MGEFAELVTAVRVLKDEKKRLNRERENICGNWQRYEDIRHEINAVTNKLYDAVGDLNEYIEVEAGISAYDLPDLLRSDGYVMSKHPLVSLPKRVNFD